MKTLKNTLFALSCLALMTTMMSCRNGATESGAPQAPALQEDTLQTTAGPLTITFIGHGTLMLTFKGKVYHIDPWTNLADYSALPKADVILVTHDHSDHLDAKAIKAICQDKTQIIASPSCEDKLPGAIILENGQTKPLADITVEAVPAYNIQHKRPDGRPYHPQGGGNGYILTFAKTRVYIAGDTEDTPEMKALKAIDVAFCR